MTKTVSISMKDKANPGWCEPDASNDLPKITSELQAEILVGAADAAALRQAHMKSFCQNMASML